MVWAKCRLFEALHPARILHDPSFSQSLGTMEVNSAPLPVSGLFGWSKAATLCSRPRYEEA